MVVEKDFILAAFYDACAHMDEMDAIEHTAALTGQSAETVAEIVTDEATA